MAKNCDEQFCDWKAKDGAFVWAPCGTHTTYIDADTGVYTPPPVADIGEIGEDAIWTFEDASSLTINTPRATNTKATLRCKDQCTSTVESNSLDLELCWCWANQLHCDLSDTEESCTIDFMYFPQPEVCDMPNPATDFFYWGTVKGGIESIGGAASNTEGETVTVSLQGCGSKFKRYGFKGGEVVVPLQQKAPQRQSLTLDKEAA